jgi:hypothetical protein
MSTNIGAMIIIKTFYPYSKIGGKSMGVPLLPNSIPKQYPASKCP